MFLRLPFQLSSHIAQTVLILNTVVLIIALVVAELLYAEMPKQKRAHLRYFYPLVIVMSGLLVLAIVKQAQAA